MSAPLYGLMAEFRTPEALLEAVRALRAQGFSRLQAYTPFPVEGLAPALGLTRNSVALCSLLGGLVGGIGGFFMQWYAATIAYPVNVGGRPLNSWPMFIPVAFELAILGAALAAVIGMLAANGLPRLTHPVFAAPGFDLATRDRFFLCVRATDTAFERYLTEQQLRSLAAVAVTEVPL